MFDRTEWFSKMQIQGFFSRLSAGIKQRIHAQQEPISTNDDSDAEEEEDDLVEEYACDVDEERLREARDIVMGKIGLKHPIMYDIYDLCTLAREERLPTLKVKILKDMCTHFDLRSDQEILRQFLFRK